MKWFGKASFAPLCADCAHVPAPVGEKCQYCGEPIEAGDNGLLLPPVPMAFHHPCFFRTTVGSIGHQAGVCGCKEPPRRPAVRIVVPGGTVDDPPGLTAREAAQAALEFWEAPDSPAIRQALLSRWLAVGAARFPDPAP